ncbi:MAG: GNAT family N-acetyltransferase [Oscillospiraceae bacterium]|nr:GNAT family N-acetyltransferase [Oscillospiraceae bacterium]
MIVPVDQTNLSAAAVLHSAAWQAAHRPFCTAEFVAAHTPARQEAYLKEKIARGSRFFLLTEAGAPIGIVSVTDSLIEDLYILPGMQRKGYGTKLLCFAISRCSDTPTLWILENNMDAERLYRRLGFRPTGRRNCAGKLAEIEFAKGRVL